MASLTAPLSLRSIEQLYAGEVGDAYVQRIDRNAFIQRRRWFWSKLAWQLRPYSVLEVGCGNGINLACLPEVLWRVGVDVHRPSLQRLDQDSLPVGASASALPFSNRAFDLVFTSGLLMHVPKDSLPGALNELVRVANRAVLLIEYEDEAEREIPWHGLHHVLWARPYRALFRQLHPSWWDVLHGELTAEQGWDRLSYSLFVRGVG